MRRKHLEIPGTADQESMQNGFDENTGTGIAVPKPVKTFLYTAGSVLWLALFCVAFYLKATA